MTNELEQYIQSYFGISKDNLLQVMALFQEQTLSKGDFFCKTGRYCLQLGFIQEGIVRVYAESNDQEITQWIGTKGYFITDLSSLIFSSVARWNIQALTDCTLYVIDKKDYDNIGQLVPEWQMLEKLFLAKCFMTMEDRIFTYISKTATERYELLFQQAPELFNQVPLQYIASMLGMTPETFSRIRKAKLSS
jgi:CRP-like cAMP-binding protein